MPKIKISRDVGKEDIRRVVRGSRSRKSNRDQGETRGMEGGGNRTGGKKMAYKSRLNGQRPVRPTIDLGKWIVVILPGPNTKMSCFSCIAPTDGKLMGTSGACRQSRRRTVRSTPSRMTRKRTSPRANVVKRPTIRCPYRSSERSVIRPEILPITNDVGSTTGVENSIEPRCKGCKSDQLCRVEEIKVRR
jgi:hypothetical protein